MKVCTKCKIEKDEIEFTKNTSAKDGLAYVCKLCVKKYNQEYYLLNKDRDRINKKLYNQAHKEEIKKRKKEYRQIHKEEIKIYNRLHYLENKEEIDIYYKEYRKKRNKEDPIFKLRTNFSRAINHSLNKNDTSKAGESCFSKLPYTLKDLKTHIESKFEPGMTWGNQGPYSIDTWDDNDPTTWMWHLDHIVPQSHFQFTSMDDIEFQKCWALENLRPLWAKQNVLDGNRR